MWIILGRGWQISSRNWYLYFHRHVIVETLFWYFDFISFYMNACPKRIRKASILLILFTVYYAYGHTTLSIPVLVWSEKIYSDNFSTFVAAAKWLKKVQRTERVQEFLSQDNIRWQFNLSRAPWWGGQFERMVGLVKQALYKVVGKATLTWDYAEDSRFRLGTDGCMSTVKWSWRLCFHISIQSHWIWLKSYKDKEGRHLVNIFSISFWYIKEVIPCCFYRLYFNS